MLGQLFCRQIVSDITLFNTDNVGYDYGSSVTYSCLEGTEFFQGLRNHVARCSKDCTWQPPLLPEQRCQTV